MTYSLNVSINRLGAARLGDQLQCSCAIDAITRGSATVSVNGRLLARQGDSCVEGQVTGGSGDVVAGGDSAKPCLDWILENYQVESDTMVEWAPTALGINLTDPREITQTEADLLNEIGLWRQNDFKGLADEALGEAQNRFPANTLSDGHGDAFRHAYWNALGARHMGEEWMEQFATAHEGIPAARSPAAREAMDLYNNQVGRRIAAHNPDASDDELADLIAEALEAGELLVIDPHGNIAWSDEVEIGATGNADGGEPGDPAIDTPDGDAEAEY